MKTIYYVYLALGLLLAGSVYFKWEVIKQFFFARWYYFALVLTLFITIYLVRVNYVIKIMDKDEYFDNQVCKGELTAAEYQVEKMRDARDKANADILQ